MGFAHWREGEGALNRFRQSENNPLFSSLLVQMRVISALIIREGSARFGHDNLGFFWILVEPLILAGMVMILWAVTNHGHTEQVGIVLFVLTGYCGLTLWRHIVGRSAKLIRQRAALLFHVNVKPIDLILATGILETMGIFAAFVCAYVPLVYFELVHPPHDLLLVAGGWLFLSWFSIAFGLILSALTEMSEPIERLISPFMYVTIPLTGVFSLIDWLPPAAQRLLEYSPIATSIEMFRAGTFPEDVITHYSVPYLVCVCILMTAIGIPLMNYAQKFVTFN